MLYTEKAQIDMSWKNYAVKRIFTGVFTLFGASILIFILLQLVPGDPARLRLGGFADEEVVENLREEMGLNDPLYVQFYDWIIGVLSGDWGSSFVNEQPVFELIMGRLPESLQLALFSLIIALILSLPLGVIAAVNSGSRKDSTIIFLSQTGIAVPSFWFGIILSLIFARHIGIFPASGSVSFTTNPIENIRHLFLPALSLGVITAAILTRYLRSEMIEVMNSDYILTANAYGHPRRRIVWKYALKNALIPYVTMVGLQVGFLIGGVVVIEEVFAYDGIGRLILSSIQSRDFPVVQMSLLLLAATFIVANLIVDLLYAYLNPKIKY